MWDTLQKLFHKHDIVWTSRKHIANAELDWTTHGFMIDIQPAKTYLYEGYCIKCGQKGFISKVTIAEMFDKQQPYDKVD